MVSYSSHNTTALLQRNIWYKRILPYNSIQWRYVHVGAISRLLCPTIAEYSKHRLWNELYDNILLSHMFRWNCDTEAFFKRDGALKEIMRARRNG
jgi:hypothetical protein